MATNCEASEINLILDYFGRVDQCQNLGCSRCGTNVENMNRIQQDEHEIECKKQMKLPF